ncbi:MAG: HIT family protein [Proteobacteria bacterium]|nr:HIT family protein [Pseudomonadota bacterium]
MTDTCIFCAIAARTQPASVILEDDHTLAFMDLRQFHPGHVLVIPRRHMPDVRALDAGTGAALMSTIARVTQAVTAAFPCQGASLWHSIGEAADQEVPHLHFHVHPRAPNDGLLRIYPAPPSLPARTDLEAHAARLREHLNSAAVRHRP